MKTSRLMDAILNLNLKLVSNLLMLRSNMKVTHQSVLLVNKKLLIKNLGNLMVLFRREELLQNASGIWLNLKLRNLVKGLFQKLKNPMIKSNLETKR